MCIIIKIADNDMPRNKSKVSHKMNEQCMHGIGGISIQ